MTTEIRYQSMHSLPAMAAVMDPDGAFLDVTDEFVCRLGYSRQELRGRTPEDIATPESARHIRQEHLPRFRRTGKLDHVRVEFLAADGQSVELLAVTNAEYDEQGAVAGSWTVFTDPSDQNRLERRYRDLYLSTPAMLHTVDSDGRIVDVSDHWLEKLGYQREEVVGRTILDFMSDDSQRVLRAGRMSEILAGEERKNMPRQMINRSGEVLDVLVSTRRETDESSGNVRIFVASKDVTERNRAEAELRDAYEVIARLKEELERERDYLREEVQVQMNFGQIIGESPALKSMLARIEAVANTPASVLIVGETGTGKELVAHAIHGRSSRSAGPLVKVNCAAIPEELFESEFFGHVKGAFTGAHQDRVGRFQLAHGGTIFLDEVAEIPLGLQGKLLRVLQEREFERVGEDQTRHVDVRVIAATNKDLEKEVENGNFREDLYYRLGVFPVQVPPLRRRSEDVPMLAIHFLEQVCREFGIEVPAFTQTQMDAMKAYHWPGNIRELKNVIERAVILSTGEVLRLDLSLPEANLGLVDQGEAKAVPDRSLPFITDAQMKERQRENIIQALEHSSWRVSGRGGAAELLQMPPTTLTDRMRSLKIEKPAAG